MSTTPLAPPTPITPGKAHIAAPTTTSGMNLRRLRWAVRATLTLGVTVSTAANILHAEPHPISQAIAAWPPLALLLTVELISRVPTHRKTLTVIRLTATTGIAGIATWISYWHLAGVAARYGESGAAVYLLPLSVDGLVVVASVSLVEIGGRIRANTHTAPKPAPAPDGPGVPSPATTPSAAPTAPVRRPRPAAVPPEPGAESPSSQVAGLSPTTAPTTDAAPGALAGDGDPQPAAEHDDGGFAGRRTEAAAPATAPTPAGPHAPDPTAVQVVAKFSRHDTAKKAVPLERDGEEPVPKETAAAVAFWYHRAPNLHPAEIGARIGRSERTVRRYWPPAPDGIPSSRAVK